MLNIYSDSSQLALKYLKDTESNIHNIIIITGDLNIRDSKQDPNYPFHSIHSNSLLDIANSFSLDISNPIENVPTRFSDNDHNANSVLDLVFLCPSFPEFNQHHIHPDQKLSSDHILITIEVSICKERIMHSQHLIAKGSNKEKQFIKNVIQIIKNLNMSSIQNAEILKRQFIYLCPKLRNYGKEIQNQLKSQDTPKHGGTTNVDYHLTNINYLKVLKTGIALKALSRKQNIFCSITKQKKLQTKSAVHGNL